MLQIRKCTEGDKDSILTVYKECEDFLALGPVPTASMRMVEEDIQASAESKGRYCIVLCDNKIIGVADFIPSYYENESSKAYISLIMITKNYRCNGIGRKTVSEVERIITENPAVTKIYVSVQTNNERAISFWTRHGYIRVSEAELQSDTTIVYHFCKDICHN